MRRFNAHKENKQDTSRGDPAEIHGRDRLDAHVFHGSGSAGAGVRRRAGIRRHRLSYALVSAGGGIFVAGAARRRAQHHARADAAGLGAGRVLRSVLYDAGCSAVQLVGFLSFQPRRHVVRHHARDNRAFLRNVPACAAAV